MSRRPAVLFVNLRRPRSEAAAAILGAHRQGLSVALLADKRPPFPREAFVDIEIVDTFDEDRAAAAGRALAARNDIRGILTWADRDVELVCRLGTELGLPAPPPEAARRARHKFEMKQALAHLDNLVPRHARIRSSSDLDSALSHVGLPAVLKPVGASGSKGIFELREPADADEALRQLERFTRPEVDPVFRQHGSELILEEFLTGAEVSVEGWVSGGRVVVAGITDKWTSEPWHLETQHVHPARCSDSERQDAIAAAERVVSNLGLDHCAFHLEGKLTSTGFRFIEVAARSGGDYIGSHLIPRATGIDFYGSLVRVATGACPAAERGWEAVAGVRFVVAEQAGRLAWLEVAAPLEEPWVDAVLPELRTGALVNLPPTDFVSSRVAAVLATAPAHPLVEKSLTRAAARCQVTIESTSGC
jgi:biotin carboxylase